MTEKKIGYSMIGKCYVQRWDLISLTLLYAVRSKRKAIRRKTARIKAMRKRAKRAKGVRKKCRYGARMLSRNRLEYLHKHPVLVSKPMMFWSEVGLIDFIWQTDRDVKRLIQP